MEYFFSQWKNMVLWKILWQGLFFKSITQFLVSFFLVLVRQLSDNLCPVMSSFLCSVMSSYLCSVMSSGHEFLLAIEALTPPPLPPGLNPYSFTGKTRPGPGGGKIDIATVSWVHSMNYCIDENQFYFLLSCSLRIWVLKGPKCKQPIPSKV